MMSRGEKFPFSLFLACAKSKRRKEGCIRMYGDGLMVMRMFCEWIGKELFLSLCDFFSLRGNKKDRQTEKDKNGRHPG